MTPEQLLGGAIAVFGVRPTHIQSPTYALGWRENWPAILFAAKQNGPISPPDMLNLRAHFGVHGVQQVYDARALAAYLGYVRLDQASQHAESLVLAGMLAWRANAAESRRQHAAGWMADWRQYSGNVNVGGYAQNKHMEDKYTGAYVLDRTNNARNHVVLAQKFNVAHRRAHIVANAQACHFCGNLLALLNINNRGHNGAAMTSVPGARPLTGWWNPLSNQGIGHGAEGWDEDVPKL